MNPKLIGASIALVVLILHWSPWRYFGVEGIPEMIFQENGGHYLTLEREFWTCVFTSITLAFGIEGLLQAYREKKASDGEIAV